jgi:adenylate cyclase
LSFFNELKRRNVFKVGVAYLAVGWLILQVVELVLDSTSAPDWVMQIFLLAVAVGFPIAILLAWAFELTPEGIKLERDVSRDESITPETGRKLNRAIMIVLVAVVVFLLVDKFYLNKDAAPAVALAPGNTPALTPPPAPEAVVTETDKSVAVLPFVAMSNGPDDGYFADGLTEEILNSLARLPELLVTARTSAFHFKGQDQPIPEIASTLGVAHIVEGSVRRSGERLRITAQLIRAQDGFHLWSETYDRDTSDVFGVQTDIAEKIASALDVVLDDEQREKMRSVGLQNPEAYIDFQKGVAIFLDAHGSQTSAEKMLLANQWFEKTMALAPTFSDTYSYHADYFTHALSGDFPDVFTTEDQLNAAMASLEADLAKAIEYAPDEARRSANAYDLDLVTGRWRGLESRFEQLIELTSCYQPNWPDILASPYGRAADVRKLGEKAIECDPLSFSGWMVSASASIWLGDFDAALETTRRGFEATGHRIMTLENVEALIGSGQFEQATDLVEREFRDEGTRLIRLLRIAAAKGDRPATNALLEEFLPISNSRIPLLQIYAVTGELERANEIATEFDTMPFGYLTLVRTVHSCNCGAPFDLEATPDFAKRIRDAELPWPPPSPINWPLKSW